MKEKLTSHQFFTIMFLLPYGSANLFFLAPETKNNIWIALLFYGIIFCGIQIIYIQLFKQYPNDSIVTYLPKIYGTFIGKILSIIYIWFFAYDASRNLRDFVELLTSFSLIRLPTYIISIVFIIVILYSVYKGIENIGSLSQVGFTMAMEGVMLIFILLICTKGVFKPSYILPILHGGFTSTIAKGWKLLMFPFGEFITMTMLYPFVIQKTKLSKTILFATITESIVLAVNNILFLITLGSSFAVTVNYPLLETVRLIHISEFLNRLDIIFLIFLMSGMFFKISILMYSSVLGTMQLFKLKRWGLICIIFAILICATSLLIAKTYPEHIHIGFDIALPYIHLPICIIIPMVSLLVYYIKRLIRPREINP